MTDEMGKAVINLLWFFLTISASTVGFVAGIRALVKGWIETTREKSVGAAAIKEMRDKHEEVLRKFQVMSDSLQEYKDMFSEFMEKFNPYNKK